MAAWSNDSNGVLPTDEQLHVLCLVWIPQRLRGPLTSNFQSAFPWAETLTSKLNTIHINKQLPERFEKSHVGGLKGYENVQLDKKNKKRACKYNWIKLTSLKKSFK